MHQSLFIEKKFEKYPTSLIRNIVLLNYVHIMFN